MTYSQYDTAGNPVWTTTGDYAPGRSSASQSRTNYEPVLGRVGNDRLEHRLLRGEPAIDVAAVRDDRPERRRDPARLRRATGDLTSSSTPDGNAGGEVAETTYGYDGDGELTTVTAPDGNLTGANAANFTTTNTYTATASCTPRPSATPAAITARKTHYGYDGDGNQTSVTDPRGKTTDYAYNADDQPTWSPTPTASRR